MLGMTNKSNKKFDAEYDQIDLEPYISGKRQMMFTCSHDGCKEKIDITKSYIMMEEQNNIRKQAKGYNPACDKLYIFTRYCPEHEIQKERSE